jgi:hypothetical protein
MSFTRPADVTEERVARWLATYHRMHALEGGVSFDSLPPHSIELWYACCWAQDHLVAAGFTTSQAASLVDEYGMLPWRGPAWPQAVADPWGFICKNVLDVLLDGEGRRRADV